MNKAILVSLAILTVSTSAASAWTHRSHHSRAVIPNAAAAAMNPTPKTRPMNAYAATGAPAPMQAGSSKDHEMYMKNIHDSGYDPKNDLTQSGTMRQQ
jgi:hypothetical protein